MAPVVTVRCAKSPRRYQPATLPLQCFAPGALERPIFQRVPSILQHGKRAQEIEVPVRICHWPDVVPQASTQPAGAMRAACIQVIPRREAERAQPPDADFLRGGEDDMERIAT